MLLGHWIEMRSILGAGEALKQLAKLMPSNAHKMLKLHLHRIIFIHFKEKCMTKILCVLYDDPVNGYPKSYASRDVQSEMNI